MLATEPGRKWSALATAAATGVVLFAGALGGSWGVAYGQTAPGTAPGPPPEAVVGQAGTTFSIAGGNFGTSLPSVTFAGGAGLPRCSTSVSTGCVASFTNSRIEVRAPAGTGQELVAISGADNLSSHQLLFDYNPAITEINPTSGQEGATIRLVGGNMGTALPFVTFTGSPTTTLPACTTASQTGCIASHTSTHIVLRAPAGSGLETVSVSGVDDDTSTGMSFDYDATISRMAPTFGTAGTPVHIKGSNFGETVSTVTFGGTALSTCTSPGQVGCVAAVYPTAITVRAPAGSGSEAVAVAQATVSEGGALTFDYNPTITRMIPIAGAMGTLVELSGGNFGTALPAVSWNGSTLAACANSAVAGCIESHTNTAIRIRAPSGSGQVGISVSGADNQTGAALTFDYNPAILTVRPTIGQPGTTVHISGRNLPASPSVTFAGVSLAPCTSGQIGCIVASSANAIVVRAPGSSGGTQPIVVGGADDLTGGQMQFNDAAIIATMTPEFGATGTILRISGQNFGTGLPSVAFGAGSPLPACTSGQTGCIAAHSTRSITIRAPSGSGQEAVVVANAATPPSGLTFDYNPIITRI